MRETDHKLINQIKRTHAKVTDKVLRVMLDCGIGPDEIQHIFVGPEDEEYILWGTSGYQINIDFDGEGRVTCEARPGEFLETSGAMPLWVHRITPFHRTIGNNETSH